MTGPRSANGHLPPATDSDSSSGDLEGDYDRTQKVRTGVIRRAPLPPQITRSGQTVTWQGFRIPSQDQNGHSERAWFKAQPGHIRMAQQVVSSNIFPYRDVGDFFRHALSEHLKWLETLIPIPSVTKQVDAIMEVLKEEEWHADFRTMFEKLAAQVSVYIQLGSDREARALVRRVRQYIDDMPMGDWQQRYVDEMEKRFGSLTANARGVPLSVWLEGDDGDDEES